MRDSCLSSRSTFPASFALQNAVFVWGLIPPRLQQWLCQKTTMHKDHRVTAREYEVGLSRKVTAVKAEPIAKPVRETANRHLRCGISRPDSAHICATLIR